MKTYNLNGFAVNLEKTNRDTARRVIDDIERRRVEAVERVERKLDRAYANNERMAADRNREFGLNLRTKERIEAARTQFNMAIGDFPELRTGPLWELFNPGAGA